MQCPSEIGNPTENRYMLICYITDVCLQLVIQRHQTCSKLTKFTSDLDIIKLNISIIVLGSFKTRGLANQLAHLPSNVLKNKQGLVAMSAGNYGKAFAFAAQQLGLPATVVMPDNAPVSRIKIIEVRYSNSEVTRRTNCSHFYG